MNLGLSKSRIMSWRQCPKRLWLEIHRPDQIELTDADRQRFATGHQVGGIARSLFPGGLLIAELTLREAINATRRALAEGPQRPVFEATFERDGVLCQADILLPEADGYRMIEVKSSTAVKDYHLEDCAVQAWVTEARVRITGVDLAHIDREFLYPGGADYRGLLTPVPIQSRIDILLDQVPDWVAGARATLAGPEPVIGMGRQCEAPFPCSFQGYCANDQVEAAYPLSCLPRLSAGRRHELEAMRVFDVRDVPSDFPLTEMQRRVVTVTQQGVASLSASAGEQLVPLPYPRYYLDFETVSMAVPLWAGTRPYQAVPVQWSCHVEPIQGKVWHREFLAEPSEDPRRDFATALIGALGTDGPVFVYNDAFELRILREVQANLPDLGSALAAIAARVVDLLPLTRAHYYRPDMLGSWSLKAVLPAVAPDLTYQGMDISDGSRADSSWQEILSGATSAERRDDLRRSLAAYCALDTWATVRVAWFLQRMPGYGAR